MKVYVCYSEAMGLYHITDASCPTCTSGGCQCDKTHDVVAVYERYGGKREKALFGLPDFPGDCRKIMEWTTPLKAIREKE